MVGQKELVGLLVRETLFGKDKKARSAGFNEGTFMCYYEDGKVMDSNHIPARYFEECAETVNPDTENGRQEH